MRTDYAPSMTMRQALRRYFDVNGFGESGGYEDAWVDFKLGPIPFPFPNSAARKRAVRYHDLHHILTSYDTDIVGEFEISAWELAAGCRDFYAAWVLNLGGTAGGCFVAPRRTFAAFVRGRRTDSLYGKDYDALLAGTVASARSTAGTDRPAEPATLSDAALFALTATAGLLVGLLTFVTVLPLLPLGLLTSALKKRAEAQARA